MRKVLVADDDESLREITEHVLSEAGYQVFTARDGQEGWEILEKDGAEMAVLDLNMPRLDGLQLTRKIRADARFKAMPILMLTVRDLVEEQLAGYEHGADDYLTKPFDHAVLAARVRALERRAF